MVNKRRSIKMRAAAWLLTAGLGFALCGCFVTPFPAGTVPHSGFANAPPARPAPPAPAARPSRRPDAPVLVRLPNGHYRVARPWTVQLDGRVWRVPVGYTTNGITAPAKLKKSLGDGVQYPETWAAVFHDWLFTRPGVSRSAADRSFYNLLLAYGVPETKATLMFTTVSAYSMSKNLR